MKACKTQFLTWHSMSARKEILSTISVSELLNIKPEIATTVISSRLFKTVIVIVSFAKNTLVVIVFK